jgi:hypothetical protein
LSIVKTAKTTTGTPDIMLNSTRITLFRVSKSNHSCLIRCLCLVAGHIKQTCPDASIVFNQVPKMWAMSDIYCQLVNNEEDANPNYDIVPRIGAFEISLNGVVSYSINAHFPASSFDV